MGYSRRLDKDLNKFKMDLEADNAGITQILEAKVSRQLAEEEAASRYNLLGSGSSTEAASSSNSSEAERAGSSGNKSSQQKSSSQISLSSNGYANRVKNTKGSDSKLNTGQIVSRKLLGNQAPGGSGSAGGSNQVKRESLIGKPADDSEDDDGFDTNDNDDPGDEWVQRRRKGSTFGFYTPPTSPPQDNKFLDSVHSMDERYSLPKSLDMLEKVTGNIAKNYDNSLLKNRPKRQTSCERIRGGPGSKPAYVPSGIDSSQYVLSPIVGSTKRKRKLDQSATFLSNDTRNREIMDQESSEDNNEEISAADSSEQRWCICNEYSYGNMIACDNLDCPIEWFHYPCVGIPESGISKKKWYCPNCKGKEKLKKKTTTSKKG